MNSFLSTAILPFAAAAVDPKIRRRSLDPACTGEELMTPLMKAAASVAEREELMGGRRWPLGLCWNPEDS